MDKKEELTVREFIDKIKIQKKCYANVDANFTEHAILDYIIELAEQLPSECECEFVEADNVKSLDTYTKYYQCSNCKRKIRACFDSHKSSPSKLNYCPNCGAKIKRSDNGDM